MNFFNVSQIRITAYSVEYSKVNRNTITSIVHNNFLFFSLSQNRVFLGFQYQTSFFFSPHLRFWVSEVKELRTKTTGATLQWRLNLRFACVCAFSLDCLTAVFKINEKRRLS